MEDQLAETLAICIEKIEKGEATLSEILAQYPQDASELGALLSLVNELKNAPEVSPGDRFIHESRASFTKTLRDHNVTERKSEGLLSIIKVTQRMNIGTSLVIGRALVFGIIAVMLSFFTVQAAHEAMPGSVLYPVKIGLEKIQLALADDQKDIELQVEFAQTRNQEIIYLNEIEQYDEIGAAQEQFGRYIDQVAEELDAIATETGQTNNETIVNDLDEALQNHVEVLQDLLTKVPEQARPAIEKAIEESTKQIDDLTKSEKDKAGHPDNNNKNNHSNDAEIEQGQTVESTASPTVTPTAVITQVSNPSNSAGFDPTKTSPNNHDKNNAEPTKEKPGKP